LSTPFLSIIIPAYNEERRLPVTLEQASGFLQSQPFEIEVLVVENGSTDNTLQIAENFASQHPHFHVIKEAAKGKGLAVRRGMLEAHGEYRFMCDADFSMPIEQIPRFLPPALNGVDIAIASREAPGAIRYNEPHHRHFVGRVFNSMIRLLALPSLHDTQCGFKCFRAKVAKDVFRRQTLTGWSFDVELAIPWYFNPNSKIDVWEDSFKMAMDLFQIRWNDLRGVYSRQQLAEDQLNQ
jgi:glycosyltransferase involved in cell wall biosynthesis